MEKSKIEEFNPWWISGKVDEALALPFKRELFLMLDTYIKKRFIIAITGLRRTGKTTLLYQHIQKFLQEKVPPANILFFSFDDTSVNIEDVLNTYKEIHTKDFRKEKVYIFLDEIQKKEHWEDELKKYYDLYPNIKFFISGSESLFIRKKKKESLAGRIFEFLLPPFTFREYLQFHAVPEEQWKYETKIVPFFITFAEKGGFPETFTFDNEKDSKEYIRSLVIDKIAYKDIPKIFGIDDPEFLTMLLELISTNPGMYIDYQSLSKQFGKDRRVIKDYLSYIQESFLITILGNYRKGSITTLRKKKRAYPTDTALSYLYKTNKDESFFGKIVETAIVNSTHAKSFWKNGTEIDIIKEGIPIEIKYQESINSEDYKAIKMFMNEFKQRQGIIVTKKIEDKKVFNEGTIQLIPAWKFLLERTNL